MSALHYRTTPLLRPLVIAALLTPVTVSAAPRAALKQYPLYCAGLVVGISRMRDARRMYGEGLVVPNEAHGAGRYYVDPRRRVTLHVVTGVDDAVGELTYSRGVRLPAPHRGKVPAQAVAPRLTERETVQYGTRLGQSPEEVIRAYGKPGGDRKQGRSRLLRYQAGDRAMSHVLVYEAEFRFENDRLVSVRLYNGC